MPRTLTRSCCLLVLAASAFVMPPAAGASMTPQAHESPPMLPAPAGEMSMTMPPDCSGYREHRVFLEVQAWWKGPNTPNGRAHLHAGTCFPLAQRVHGILRFEVRVIMHNNPGHLFSLSTSAFGGRDRNIKLDKRCRDTCEWWFTTYVNTRTTLDGWHEFRFKPRVRFKNDNRMLTSTGWPAYIDNGVRVGDENRDSIGALVSRGWYEDHGYQNPQLENARAANGRPIKGIWRPEVRLDRGAQGYRPTSVGAFIDPDFHNHDPGLVILSRSRAFRGRLTIDTRSLSNGWHRLALRVTARHDGRENSGLEVIYFNVQN